MSRVSVCIDIAEMKQGIEFYTKALDFELVNEGEEYSELAVDGIKVYLIEKASGTNPLFAHDVARSYDRHWTPVHLDFSVNDIDKCVSKVVEFGGIKEEEKSGDWGSIAFCVDPFGNGFCIMEHHENKKSL